MGVLLLAGCAGTQSSGVIPLDPGTYGMTVTSRNLAAATETALTEATGFCTRQALQTQLLRTQINPGDYQLIFRCVGANAAALPTPDRQPDRFAERGRPGRTGRGRAVPTPDLPPAFDYGGPSLANAPVLNGQAFTAPPEPDQRLARFGAPATAAARPMLPGGLPAQPPTLAALMAASRQVPQPLLEAEPPRRGWFSRVFGADDSPGVGLPDPARGRGFAPQADFGPSPLPAGLQPYRVPEAAGPSPRVPAPAQRPQSLAEPPMMLAPPPPPLQRPAEFVAPAAAPARPGGPVFAPLPVGAPAPARAYETLPPITGLPGGPPQRALTPLPPIGDPPPQRAFITDVPTRLPPPAGGQAATEAGAPTGSNSLPPSGFWETRRN